MSPAAVRLILSC